MFVLIVIWAFGATGCFLFAGLSVHEEDLDKTVAIAIFWPLAVAYYIARGTKDLIYAAIEKW